jgi:medium-chain acyl-[acyl-carrier-protein] hydrolase
MNNNKWFVRYQPRPQARLRLFCFVFAGGSASAFRLWHRVLPDWVDVCAVQYPGRETRWGELPESDAGRLSAGIAAGLGASLGEIPFAFFGHSLGALIAFEVARLLRAAGEPEPRRMFLSGRRAPQFKPHPPVFHPLNDQEFAETMGTLNGTPREVLDSPELMGALMPILRADFTLDELYVHQPGEPLWQDFSIYGGRDDAKVPEDHLRSWAGYTRGESRFRLFPGDHFYLRDMASAMFGVLGGELEETIRNM